MKQYALIFSGQGSERVGMFHDIRKDPTALDLLLDTLAKELDIDLRDAVVTKDAAVVAKNNQLLLSMYHHLVSTAVIENLGYRPALCMGHSFGQFSALTSAGAVDFIEMMKFIRKRTEIINCDTVAVQATFKSIHGMTLEAVEQFIVEEGLLGEVELALHNQKEQVVCAATSSGAEKLEALAAKYSYMLKDVPVSRPYHTSFMEAYNQMLIPHIEHLVLSTPKNPVLLNHSKKAATNSQLIREETLIQMVKPVLWYDCILEAAEQVDAFVIVDPSETQFKILRRITNKKIHNLNNWGAVKMLEKRGV